jgi:hypothetical protein
MKKTKTAETARIREFLEFSGSKIKGGIKTYQPDPPDAVATIKLPDQSRWLRVAIEETRYYSGTKPGRASQQQELYDLWELVRTSVARRIARRQNFSKLY